MPAMSITGTPDQIGRFTSNLINALHRSRRIQANRVIADHRHLLAAADQGMISVARVSQPCNKRDRDQIRARRLKTFGALPGAIAVVLIALHVVCAAVIIDRALAHAPAAPAVSHDD